MSPLHDVVIIRRSAPETVSAGGVHIVHDEDFKQDIGEVVFIGPGKLVGCKHCGTQERIPMDVKPGDRVLFSTSGHQITQINGEEFVVLKQPSIIGVIGDGVESGTYQKERDQMGFYVQG